MRRRLRFSVRSCLLVTTILALLLGWIAHEQRMSALETESIRQLLNSRKAVFDVSFRTPWPALPSDPNLKASAWRRTLGALRGKRVAALKCQFDERWTEDLRFLGAFSRLQRLTLAGKFPNEKLKSIDAAKDLEGLRLRMPVYDLQALSRLTKLKWLDLSFTGCADLEPLANLTQLTALDISGTRVKDLRFLAKMSNLKELNISDTDVHDLSPLSQLRRLTVLHASGTQIDNVTCLAGSDSLESLDLRHSQVYDLTSVGKLKALRTLKTTVTQAIRMDPLAECQELRSLEVGAVEVLGVLSLTHCRKLRELTIHPGARIDFDDYSELRRQLKSCKMNVEPWRPF